MQKGWIYMHVGYAKEFIGNFANTNIGEISLKKTKKGFFRVYKELLPSKQKAVLVISPESDIYVNKHMNNELGTNGIEYALDILQKAFSSFSH
ncbi:hypothetical protein IKQ21_03885, partial [bacterium]|nr:hypothetical protein [bacterium]